MKPLIILSCISSLLCGCEAKHLAYVHESTLGLDVAASTEGTGRLMFGYDSDTYAIVPRKGVGLEAMTLVSMGCIYADGLSEVIFNHFVASGQAGILIAQSEKTLTRINEYIQGRGVKCE